jgi:serine/threonine protein kinase
MAGTLRSFASLRIREEGKCIANRYVLKQLLGEGSSSRVYAARDLVHEREVALKLLRPSADLREACRRFRSEKDALQQLCGAPYTVTLYDFGEEREEELFLVMERVHGLPLATLLDAFSKSHTQWPILLVLRWFDQTCRAIAAAHTRGVIHRDIKPSNIMITRTEPREVRVFDFGVARSPTQPQDRTREWSGTHGYMSPEQMTGDCEPTPASDVFSLAVLLTEMLAPGQMRATGHSIASMLAVWGPDSLHSRLRDLHGELPGAFWSVLVRALAVAPEERYQTAEELRLALCDALSVSSQPPLLSVTASH